MSLSRAELFAAADQAFDALSLVPDADESWQTIADMGWLGLSVPEDRGGLGQGGEARTVIHHALGRALVPEAAVAQMMVIDALAGARSDEADDLLDEAMAGGRMTASLALDNEEGVLSTVPDADRASHLLVVSDEQVALLPMAGCKAAQRKTWDETRRLFDVHVSGEERLVIAEGEDACSLTQKIRANMLLALAADSLGGAEKALAMTIDYLGDRHQFERPLAMFQALKHRCADMRVAISLADALLWQEATSSSLNLTRAGALKAQACRVYKEVAEEAIQLHGGIGLTQEHPCHLFLKRAFLNSALGGDADHWEERAGRECLARA